MVKNTNLAWTRKNLQNKNMYILRCVKTRSLNIGEMPISYKEWRFQYWENVVKFLNRNVGYVELSEEDCLDRYEKCEVYYATIEKQNESFKTWYIIKQGE